MQAQPQAPYPVPVPGQQAQSQDQSAWTWRGAAQTQTPSPAQLSESRSMIPGKAVETRGQAAPWTPPANALASVATASAASAAAAVAPSAGTGPVLDLSKPLDPNAPDPVQLASAFLDQQNATGQTAAASGPLIPPLPPQPAQYAQYAQPPQPTQPTPEPAQPTPPAQAAQAPAQAAQAPAPGASPTIHVSREMLSVAEDVRRHFALVQRCHQVLSGPAQLSQSTEFFIEGLPRAMRAEELRVAAEDITRDAAARVQKLDALVAAENPGFERRWLERTVQVLLENDGGALPATL